MEEPPDPRDPGEGPRVGDTSRADEDARSESGSDASTSGTESVSEDDDEPMLKYQRLGARSPPSSPTTSRRARARGAISSCWAPSAAS